MTDEAYAHVHEFKCTGCDASSSSLRSGPEPFAVTVPAEKIAALREAFVQRDDVSASQRNANVWNAAVHLVGWLDDHAARAVVDAVETEAAPDELTALRQRVAELEERLRETNEDADTIDERLTQASRDLLKLRNERDEARQLLADIEDRIARNRPWMPSYVEAMKRLRKSEAERDALRERVADESRKR